VIFIKAKEKQYKLMINAQDMQILFFYEKEGRSPKEKNYILIQ
jgi:hypothetical protein